MSSKPLSLLLPLRLAIFIPSSLFQLLLGAELVGVATLLLAAVGGARVEAGVAPEDFFSTEFFCLKKKSERKTFPSLPRKETAVFVSAEMYQC